MVDGALRRRGEDFPVEEVLPRGAGADGGCAVAPQPDGPMPPDANNCITEKGRKTVPTNKSATAGLFFWLCLFRKHAVAAMEDENEAVQRNTAANMPFCGKIAGIGVLV